MLINNNDDSMNVPKQLLPGIIVLNSNFVPDLPDDPFKCGAVHYALQAAKVLKGKKAFLGFVLYRRDDALISQPILSYRKVLEFPAIEIGFCFKSPRELLEGAMKEAIERLKDERFDFSENWPENKEPIIYYQTNVLLPFHPPCYPYAVTHHAPFVNQVVEIFGEDRTCKAFGGGRAKMEHLKKMQEAGLQKLRHSCGFSIEISSIQTRFLKMAEIPEERIFQVEPPVESDMTFETAYDATFEELRGFINTSGDSLLLCTAVARLDEFKRIDLLIDSAILLLKRNIEVKIIIIGGVSGKDFDRLKLEQRIPARFRKNFFFHSRLPRNVLLHLFDYLAGRGLFVCTSGYETCGFTPLEAASMGLVTVLRNDAQHVEAASFFPKKYLFNPHPESLAAFLKIFTKDKTNLTAELGFMMELSSRISLNRFVSRFTETWKMISERVSTEKQEAKNKSCKNLI